MITVFSPEGRLYQIEYAFKAAKSTGLTAIAVKGTDSVVFIAQKRVQDKLVDATSVSHLFKITEKIGCVMTGLLPDAAALVRKARELAGEFEFEHGYPIPVDYLAKRMADENQVLTQHAYKRSPAAIMMIGGVDDEKGPMLFKVDPAGHFVGYKATAAGVKEQDAMNSLEKKFKTPVELSADETVRLALSTMQVILTSDFKTTEIEVAVAVGSSRFRVLTEAEVEAHLNVLSERE